LEKIVKVFVDKNLCEANAKCVDAAPEVFELDDDDELHIRIVNIRGELEDKVLTAVRRCPRQALCIE
jgi:ferredoxin